jgi:hypothetical protein
VDAPSVPRYKLHSFGTKIKEHVKEILSEVWTRLSLKIDVREYKTLHKIRKHNQTMKKIIERNGAKQRGRTCISVDRNARIYMLKLYNGSYRYATRGCSVIHCQHVFDLIHRSS